MIDTDTAGSAPAAASIRSTRLRSALRLPRRPLLGLSLAVLALLLLVAVFADHLVLHDPESSNLVASLRPPVWSNGGSWTYPLGTDMQGRDIASRMMIGARYTAIVALGSIVLGAGLGTIIGLVAGYYGGWRDVLLMRATDTMLAFPVIVLALCFVVAAGASTTVAITIIALVMWARFARLVRGETLSLRTRGYVDLARVAGVSSRRIVFRHILPNLTSVLLVMVTLQVSQAVLMEATLSFLGAGIPPPTPSWGGIVADGRARISTAWWITTLPGIAIFLVVTALNVVGDWLREAADPSSGDSAASLNNPST